METERRLNNLGIRMMLKLSKGQETGGKGYWTLVLGFRVLTWFSCSRYELWESEGFCFGSMHRNAAIFTLWYSVRGICVSMPGYQFYALISTFRSFSSPLIPPTRSPRSLNS